MIRSVSGVLGTSKATLTLGQNWTTCLCMSALQLKKSLADAIRYKMAAEHLSISTFAKKTKTGRNSVRRILDGKNTAITLRTMAKAAKALNLELSLTVKPLPLTKLGKIAGQLAATDDAHKAEELKKQFMEGYYGKPIHLLDAKNPAV